MSPLWTFFDELFTARFAASLSIFVALAIYSSWLYALVLREVDDLRMEITRIAEHLEPEPEPGTEELPAVEPATAEADALDTEARKEVVLARHRPSEGSRSVADILAEAGLEPLPGRRGRR